MRDTWRAIRASVAGILISAGLLTSWLALPQSVAACSCFSGDLAEWAKLPGAVVFSGMVGPTDPIGLQVSVDRWFPGRGVAQVVHLDPAYLDRDSMGCGIAAPPPGTRWLFGGARAEGSDLITINLCTPHGDLATPEGQALLEEAATAFGAVVVAQPTAGPAATTGTDPLAALGTVAPFIAIGMSALVVAGLALLVVAIGRRLRAPD